MTPSWKRERHNKSRRGQDPKTYGMEIPTGGQDIIFGLMQEVDNDENIKRPNRKGRNRRT